MKISNMINKRINANLSLIKWYSEQLKEEESEKKYELIRDKMHLVEREQNFLIDLLNAMGQEELQEQKEKQNETR